jgi:hypothetical protein
MLKSINRINKICREVRLLSEEDFKAIESMINDQGGYISPLKGAKQASLNESAKYNQRVLDSLKSLQMVIKNGFKG